MRALQRGDVWLPAVGGVSAMALLALAIWEHSPYGRYLEHGDWTGVGLAGSVCSALPAGPMLFPLALYVVGWLLMTIAMMMPTITPLIAIFVTMTRDRSDCGTLISLLIFGYLLPWFAFGLAAHLVDMALHALAAGNAFLLVNGWVVGAVVIGLAGAFQFSELKYRCLDKCRTPFSFLNQHWRGAAARWQSFMLGVHPGVFCVGCCWAMMLLMFAVGAGSVGWMLAIGAVMAVEKNASWGRKLSAPLGASLLMTSITIIALNV